MKGSGWRGESHRHRLAGMGIKTSMGFPKIKRCKKDPIHNEITRIMELWNVEEGRTITPYEINNGMCEDITIIVEDNIEGAEAIWLEDYFWQDDILKEMAHSVILYNGRYYDAENPCGVSDPHNLEIVKNIGNFEYHLRMHEKIKRENNIDFIGCRKIRSI